MILDRILITHNDFDGITCAVLFKRMVAELGGYHEIHIENYETVDARIITVIQQYPEATIYITDISPRPTNEHLLAIMNCHKRIVLYDHHKTAEWLREYPWANIDQSECGASILYKWMRGYLRHTQWVPEYARLIWHARDYDLWKHESPLSKSLNNLLNIYGHQRFIDRFVADPSVELTETELLLLELEQEREQKYIKSVMKRKRISSDNNGRPYILCFAEEYLSQIGNQALNEYLDCQYVKMVNFKHGIVSLRSRQGQEGLMVDVSEIAKAHGGGGHAAAAGYPLPSSLYGIVDNAL